MTRRLLICYLIILILPLLVLADTLVVAGHVQQLSTPLIVEKDEVLAPVLPALRFLGARATVKGGTATITTPSGSTLTLSAGASEATLDGRKMRLPAMPRQVDDALYLPVKACAPLLAATLQFDAATHTLTLDPLLTVSYITRDDGVAVLVRSAAPVQYTSGTMRDPARLVFDFKYAALGNTEPQIAIAAGVVARLRLSQYSLSPATVRLVVDLTDEAVVTPSVSEGGRLVTLLIGKQRAQPAPVAEVLPSASPVKLLDATLSTRSAKQSELAISTDGPATAAAEYDAATHRLMLTIPNGVNALADTRLRDLKNSLVEKVEIDGAAATGATLTVTLKQDAGYLLQQDDHAIRVLLGSFDISDMVIVLDAGHGGHDVGAVGINGTMEKDVNLDVVLRAAKLLRNAGATVLLTRGDDTFIPLDGRPALANTKGAGLFVAVHCNSMPSKPSPACGSQTYYKTPQSAKLAAVLQQELASGLGLKDGGVRVANYLVLRKSLMPSVLLELGFLSNTTEEKLLSTPDFRQKAAQAIFNGVRRYAATRDWQLHQAPVPVPPAPIAPATPADPTPPTAGE